MKRLRTEAQRQRNAEILAKARHAKHMGTRSASGASVNTRALKSRIILRGLDAIDRRTAAARSVIEWKESVIAALGGEGNISPMKAAVIEESVRTKCYLDHIDQFLLGLDSIIDRRSFKLRPIVEARMRTAEHLMRQMDRLGLERQMKAVSPNFDITWKEEQRVESQKTNEIPTSDSEEQSEAQSNSGW